MNNKQVCIIDEMIHIIDIHWNCENLQQMGLTKNRKSYNS